MTGHKTLTLKPLVEELHVDPWHAFQAMTSLAHVCFFDSALRHETLGRYSYLMADPLAFIRWRQGQWQISGPLASVIRSATTVNPFATLQDVLQRLRQETQVDLPLFQGGLAGLWGYDLCHLIERLPRPRWDEFHTPDLAVGLYDWVYAFDHQQRIGWLISTGVGELLSKATEFYAGRRMEQARSWLRGEARAARRAVPEKLAKERLAPQFALTRCPGVTSNFSPTNYQETVRRAIDYVHAGDCFQVNVAQRLLTPLREEPWDTYARLRQHNPATFAGYFDLGDFTILSSSPERFVQVDARGVVETRPIKGTRPRVADPADDRQQVAALLASAKDRAENVMIVDLLRNDLGRTCAYGTIHVHSLCQVESYQTVHHLVSVVKGQLAPERGPIDLLRAAFPGGSVTGAPKVRAMEIIAELEPTARGPYCGSLGFIGFDGAMDTNILIRTLTGGKGWLQFPVGGGIVADSDPVQEYQETLHKAEGMLRALRRDAASAIG